ncbi:MAG: DnaJ domain-containing protein [Deltaproteobacteria bacterium]|jgi:DnaJ-class molecular chaperone|nr:DnaJ domain-containing protein [Deltaproteobacteria bacterium]
MNLDPYKALGVDKKAGPEAIKKAYRNLARKYHPDVNPGDKAAEEKFKELSMAYDILSDPAKKAEYDSLGREAFFEKGFGGTGYRPDFDSKSFPWDELFGDIFRSSRSSGRSKSQGFSFGGGSPFGGFSRASQPTKGGDREYQLTLDFRDAVKGTDITMNLDVPEQCSQCSGQGVVSNGGGIRTCPSCRGSGNLSARQTIKAHIPQGVSDGQKIRLRGKGFAGENGGQPGDLNLIVKINPDPVFTRDEKNNLLLEKKISVYQALLGGSVEVPTMSGPGTLKIPPGTQNGARFRFKGSGVSTGKKTGDLYVTIKVVLPPKLQEEARRLAEQLEALAPVDSEELSTTH